MLEAEPDMRDIDELRHDQARDFVREDQAFILYLRLTNLSAD